MSLLHAHLVFVTKYRRRMFTDAMLTFTENSMRSVCVQLAAELVEFNGEADHAPPRWLLADPGDFRSRPTTQSRTAQSVRHQFTGACIRARMLGPLWSPSHFAVSCGSALLSIIKRHIDGQARPL